MAKMKKKEASELAAARAFLVSSDAERLRMVEEAADPRALLSLVPATELWLTVKRLTPADSLLLIKNATPEQLQVMFDIEWWRGDRLEPTQIVEWLGYISACGMEKVMEYFKECDWDQILWFFKETVVVFKKDGDDTDPANSIKWPREEAPITYEGVYYFQVLDEKHDALIRHLLDILAKHDIKLYHSVLENCIWDIPSEREEEAYETRGRRMAEHGFPTFDEALSLYSPLSPSRFKMVAKKGVEPKRVLSPQYPLTVLGDRVLFINRVLAAMGGEDESEALWEIANIANKLGIADGCEIDPETLGASVVKGVGYINIGVEVLSDGKIDKAVALIKGHWLENIFQVGLNEVVKVRGGARKILSDSWMKGRKESLALLEDSYRLLMENVLRKRPLYFVGGNQFSERATRDFLSLDDIDSARRRLSEAGFFGDIVEKITGKKVDELVRIIESSSELRFSGIIITMVVKGASGGDRSLGPVSLEELNGLFAKGGLENAASDLFGSFGDWFFKRLGRLSKEEGQAAVKLMDIARERFMDDFKDTTKIGDKRCVQSVWLR